MLALLCNLAWFLLGGIWLGLSWVVAGLLFCCTIIGIPYGIASCLATFAVPLGVGRFQIAKIGFALSGKNRQKKRGKICVC